MVNLLVAGLKLSNKTFYKVVSYFDFIFGLFWLLASANRLGDDTLNVWLQVYYTMSSFLLYTMSFSAIVTYMKHRSYKTKVHKVYAICRLVLTIVMLIYGIGFIILAMLVGSYYNVKLTFLGILGIIFLCLILIHQIYLSYELMKVFEVIKRSALIIEDLDDKKESINEYVSLS